MRASRGEIKIEEIPMPVLKEAGNLQSWAISANLYGEILLESGETSEAETYFREALKIFSLRRDRYNESRSRHGLSKSLLESDPAESARQMQIYSSLRDSLYDSEMNMGLNEMHARFQNGRLQSERDSYRRSLILLSALLVLIALATALPVLRVQSRIAAGPCAAEAGTAFHGFQINAVTVELECDLVKVGMIDMNLCIEIIAVFITGRIIADFLAFAVTSHQFPLRFLYINVERGNIPEADDICILFFVAIRSFHYKAGGYTIYQLCTCAV